MSRYGHRQYAIHVMILMAIYVALTLLIWPHVRHVTDVSLKVLLAVLPSLPVLAVLVLMVRRVLLSDELEQRIYLGALGISTAVTSAFSIVGAFLAAAKVWAVDGTVLFWVFPVIGFSYGLGHLLLKRHYTGVWDFWGC